MDTHTVSHRLPKHVPMTHAAAPTRARDDAACSAVLTRITELFWRQGYLATSYDDIVRESGVGRKRLYEQFGGKRELFLAAIQHYRETVVKEIFRDLEAPQISPEGIAAALSKIARECETSDLFLGCLMVNTLSGGQSRDPQIAAVLEEHVQTVEDLLHDALRRAGYSEERASDLAVYLLGLLHGLFTYGRSGVGQKSVVTMMDVGLAVLKEPVR